MENLYVCACGSNTWYVNDKGMECTKCKTLELFPMREKEQSKIIETMGIPVSLPNAVTLAQARLSRLQKNESIMEKIKKLIDEEF